VIVDEILGHALRHCASGAKEISFFMESIAFISKRTIRVRSTSFKWWKNRVNLAENPTHLIPVETTFVLPSLG
jgi:hypothetical protein